MRALDIVPGGAGATAVEPAAGARRAAARYEPPHGDGRPGGQSGERPDPPQPGNETVLVAEDEDTVRALLAEVLRDAGYHVLQARDGQEAVELFDAHAAEISLVVLDAIMPRLDGQAAYEHIAAQAPQMRFLLSSGYGAEQLDAHAPLLPGVRRLDKPYVPSELLQAVRDALA